MPLSAQPPFADQGTGAGPEGVVGEPGQGGWDRVESAAPALGVVGVAAGAVLEGGPKFVPGQMKQVIDQVDCDVAGVSLSRAGTP